MELQWKRARPQAKYVNSDNNIRLRQVFARKLTEVLSQQKVLISFDETVIRGTTGRNYTWAYKGEQP